MIPDRQTCLELLAEAGCTTPVIEHVQAVARLAMALTDHVPAADPAIVEAGALLHDLGRGLDQGPDHVPQGVAFLREHGVDEVVVRCVARHMGAGIDPAQARAWGWPPEESYAPATVEEKIVAHADNLTVGTRHVGLAATLERYRSQGLDEEIARLEALEATLSEALGVAPSDVAEALGSG